MDMRASRRRAGVRFPSVCSGRGRLVVAMPLLGIAGAVGACDIHMTGPGLLGPVQARWATLGPDERDYDSPCRLLATSLHSRIGRSMRATWLCPGHLNGTATSSTVGERIACRGAEFRAAQDSARLKFVGAASAAIGHGSATEQSKKNRAAGIDAGTGARCSQSRPLSSEAAVARPSDIDRGPGNFADGHLARRGPSTERVDRAVPPSDDPWP